MLYKFSFRCGEYVVAETMCYSDTMGYIFHGVVAAGGGIHMSGAEMALRPSWELASVHPVQKGADYKQLYMSL